MIPVLSRFFRHCFEQTNWNFEELRWLAPQKRAEIEFLYGHMPYGVHNYLEQPATYFTILRNPVIRVVSEYYYWLGKSGCIEHEFIVSNGISLDDYVERGYGHCLNAHCAVLSGLIGTENMKLDVPVSLPGDVVEIAKRNLSEKFFLVGITELFDETLILLKDIFGLDYQHLAYKNSLVSKDRPSLREIPKQTIRLIENANSYDIELYDYYRNILMQRTREVGSVFDDDLSLFRKYQVGHLREF